MTKEKQELAAGLALGEGFAILTFFDQSMKEPVTGEHAQARDSGRYMIPADPAVWKAACGRGEGIGTLVQFLKEQLSGPVRGEFSRLHIMVTVPRLERLLSQRIPQALEMLGVPRKQIYLQDHQSSFFCYCVNQRRELWNGDVALLECENDVLYGYVLHIDRTKSPALASVEKAAVTPVDEKARDGRDDFNWDRERDRLFFEFLKKVFERRNVVTCYLIGDYFSPSWAQRSFSFLTSRKHVFQGGNLYSRGACYAAMERCGMLRAKDILFLGVDIIQENLSMNLRVRGRETDWPIISAGINWYEAHYECDLIPDGEKNITIWSKPMNGGEEVAHILRLDHFPDRPNRASRLRLSVYFTAPECCCVEVEDLGFGGLFRPSGMKWKRKIRL